MALGPRDTTSLVLLTGWDATALKNFQLQDGTTYDAIVAEMRTALGALNAELANHSLWSGLVSYTDEPDIEYHVGASGGFEKFTEYGKPDQQRATTEGHMLPLEPFDRALGWTWDYLRKARASQVEADIAMAINDARDLYRVRILTRLLSRTDGSGVGLGLGSAGLSPGFATTAGSTGVDFVPPTYAGVAFASTHEHYIAVAGGYVNAVFSDVKAELMEHGHMGPYTYIASSLDEASIRALTDFIPVGSGLVKYGTTVDIANISPDPIAPGVYPIGVIHDVVVYVAPGMPQYYGFGYKSYGRNSQRNPLRIRLQKGMSAPTVLAFPDPRGGSGAATPLQNLLLFTEFGVGVGDRTNGTPRYVNNATWSNGTPT
jgi:hypothetical protein